MIQLLPLVLKRLPVFLVAAALFWSGWEWRDRAADAEALEDENKLVVLQLEAQQRETRATEQARQIERLQAEQLAAVEEAAALRNQEREVVEKVVTQEVIRYVENPDAVRLVMPGEWVRIHDIAAAGRSGLPPSAYPSARAYDAAARITDAGALAVTAENYATCNAVRDQLAGLQAWALTAVD